MQTLARRRIDLTCGQMLALVLALTLCSQSLAQKPAGPDKLIEASRYAAFATDALNCRAEGGATPRDPVADAIKWTESAIKAAKELKTSERDERGRGAAFIARQTRQLSELQHTQSQLAAGAKTLEKALKQAKLISAQRISQEANPAACDARFQTLTGQLDTEQKRFSELVSGADAIVDSQPQTAISKYEEARRINIEAVEISQKMIRARSLLVQQQEAEKARAKTAKVAKRHGGLSAGAKVGWTIFWLALVGGLGYGAYELSKKKQAGN